MTPNRVPEQALQDVVDQRLPHFCPHCRRCGCAGKLRMSAFATLYALDLAGWTLTPPAEETR